MAKLLSSFLYIVRDALRLTVPKSLSLIWLIVPESFMLFFNIIDNVCPKEGLMLALVCVPSIYIIIFIVLVIILYLKHFLIYLNFFSSLMHFFHII